MSRKGKSIITDATKAILLSNIQNKIAEEGFFFTSNDIKVKKEDIKNDIISFGKTEYGIGGSKNAMEYTLRFDSSENDIRDGKRKVVFILTYRDSLNLNKKIEELEKTQRAFEGVSGQAMRNEILTFRRRKANGKAEAEKLQKLINEVGAVYALLW